MYSQKGSITRFKCPYCGFNQVDLNKLNLKVDVARHMKGEHFDAYTNYRATKVSP